MVRTAVLAALLFAPCSPGGAATPALTGAPAHPVAINAEEYGGRTAIHRDMVHRLLPLGRWTGMAARYPLPPATPGLSRAVLVENGKGGPIVAAAKL